MGQWKGKLNLKKKSWATEINSNTTKLIIKYNVSLRAYFLRVSTLVEEEEASGSIISPTRSCSSGSLWRNFIFSEVALCTFLFQCSLHEEQKADEEWVHNVDTAVAFRVGIGPYVTILPNHAGRLTNFWLKSPLSMNFSAYRILSDKYESFSMASLFSSHWTRLLHSKQHEFASALIFCLLWY